MIVVRIYEGLGNQMFEYAYAYALDKRARKKDITIYLDMRDGDATIYDVKRYGRPLEIQQFCISLPTAGDGVLRHWRYIVDNKPIHRMIGHMQEMGLWKYRVIKEDAAGYGRDLLIVRDRSYLVGWFQQYQYFERYREELLKEFTLRERFQIPASLQQILDGYQVVSMHIRRGDYVTDPDVRKAMYVCGKDYYMRALGCIKDRLSRPYLFLFTNDEKWVRENLIFDIPYTVISGHYGLSDIQEMVLMSQCSHNIIANSTFSWWGAWLNTHKDKIVIAPKKWFIDKRRKNIAMEGWIKM